ncbi:MAG TPA: Fe-S cluster assembly protein SufD [Candidatus Eisenbacteria bacterium]
MTLDVTLDRDHFVVRHGELAKSAGTPAWLASLRQKAISHYQGIGLPTTHQEEWRFTNTQTLNGTRFEPAPAATAAGIDIAAIERLTLGGDLFRIGLVNGRFSPELTNLAGLPAGVTVQTLSDALRASSPIVEANLGRHARWENNAYSALNTALFEEGVVVHVGKGVVLEKPIHVLHVTIPGSGSPGVTHLRNLIVAEESAQVRVIESYVGRRGTYWTNAITEIVAGDNAVADHYRLNRESDGAFHTGRVDMFAGRSGVTNTHTITFGGLLTRNDTGVVLGGEGADSTMNGLTVIGGKQLVDNHTSIDHAVPHCTSHELYKAVLDGTARTVFNGRILVRKDAQKTDSKQTNKNLLLSDKALVNTNPQLEIYADDVKCTHGATIGQLDESMIFYLRSRGIGEVAAQHLLTYAFANDIVERIQVPALRERLNDYLIHRLRDEDGAEEAL